MVKIVFAKAAALKERQAQKTSSSVGENSVVAASSTEEEEEQDASGFAEGDIKGAKTHFLGFPKGAA